jgi:microcin C transport system substrate-binding protein
LSTDPRHSVSSVPARSLTALTRRETLLGAAAFGAMTGFDVRGAAAADNAAGGEAFVHGLSSFGELAYPPDFKHFAYVNPAAPKGGTLTVQIKNTIGNQNFDTFNTLNIFVLKGDGAAGMDATFDSLMSGSSDDPDGVYGLLARDVSVSADRLTYRFRLRPEARFHDGSRVTARDVVFSIVSLKNKGHPNFRAILTQVAGVEAEGDDIAIVRLTPQRSRDLHLVVAGLPIFSAAWWQGRDFEASTLDAPLGSGPYKVGRFEVGRFIELDRVGDYWGRDLPVNIGQNNFEHLRFEYFRDRQVAFEAFKSGLITYNEEYTSRIWATGYDFPAMKEGRVKRTTLPTNTAVPTQGWYFNTRRAQFADPRVREAIGLCFDFEWTNRTIMYSFYKRLTSYFENTPMMAAGKPAPEELKLLEPFRGKVSDEVFGEPYVPPVSDGSGSDRALLRRADELFRAAGCKRQGRALLTPEGKPFEMEFLDFSGALEPHTQPFIANLERLGIAARIRTVDAAQYRRRMDAFDFDVTSRALGGSLTPGDSLRNVFGSEAAKTEGSFNIGGIANPAVDALIDIIANARTRDELNVACRALDRVLRAGRYWVPMWYRAEAWIAHWDMFSWPDTKPKFGTGAPSTWWWDEAKAKRIGKA